MLGVFVSWANFLKKCALYKMIQYTYRNPWIYLLKASYNRPFKDYQYYIADINISSVTLNLD